MNIEKTLLFIIAASTLAIAVRVWMWPMPVTMQELTTAGQKSDDTHSKVMERIPFVFSRNR